jgi:hypothetical protein
MKKYSFVLVLMLFISPFMAQTIPSYVPSNGLVGWWPFNGNANDESGNGNHGTVNGATLTADRNGKANTAYDFTGNDEFIEIDTKNGSFDNQNYTISVWMKAQQNSTSPSGGPNVNPAIISSLISGGISADNPYSNSHVDNWVIYEINGGIALFSYSGGMDGNASNILGDYWINIIFIKEGQTVKTYKNGKLAMSSTNMNTSFFKNYPIRIGRSQHTYWKDYNGQLDDISIYNRALSEQEVQALYTGSPCAAQINRVLQPTCFFKTGQINLKANTGNAYSYSLDGKNYTTDTTFSDLAPGAYTVFVKHTSGCTDSTSVTVQPIPTSLTATTSQVGSVKICAESSMLVSAIDGRNYTYQWYKDTTLLQDSISKNLTVSKAGKYSVFISDGACSDTSDYLVLDTIPLPDAPIVNNNYIRICDKYNTYLQNIIQMNQINPSYRWYRSETGTDSLSKNSWNPIVSTSGSGMTTPFYLSQFSATNPACESKKRTRIQLEDKTPPNINYISSTTLCPGDSIELHVNNWGNSCDLEWSKEKDWVQTTIPNSQCKTSIFVKEAGRYYVYNRQCMNNYIQGENSIQIDMQTVSIQDFSNYVLKNEAPITLLGNPTGGVFSGAGVTNAVFDPSALKLGKTRIKYNYVSPSGCAGEGIKDVIVVDSSGTGGCTQIKYDTVTVKNNVYDTILKFKIQLTTGIKANQFTSMLVYPNPTSDVLLLEVTDLEAVKGYRYRILDISGKEVYTGLITEQKTAVSLKTFGAGVYVLHVLDGNNTSIATKQIVLE